MVGRKFQFPARITMLDARVLDDEVFNVLKSQLQKALQILPPWTLKTHELKIDILLHVVLWKLSLCSFKGTFGQQLLNMKYQNSQLSSNKEKLVLIFQILYYLHSNDQLVSPSSIGKEFTKMADVVFQFCEIVNLLLFFCQGKYPSVIDRVLGLRLVCVVNKPRNVGYNYMTRELIWHGFMELLTFTMSVVNYQYIRKMLIRFLFKVQKSPSLIGCLHYSTTTLCSICSKPPILPQYMGCAHVFCYYCLQTNKLVDAKFECPSCGYFNEKIEFVQL